MIAAIVGASSAIVIAVFGTAWHLSGRVSRTEQMIADLPAKLNGTVIRAHEGRCRNYAPVKGDQTDPEILM
jgi:hypothetical protein